MNALVTFGLGFISGAIFAAWYARLRKRMYAELEQGLAQIRQELARVAAWENATAELEARRMDAKLKSFFRANSQAATRSVIVQVEAGSDEEAWDELLDRKEAE